MIVHKTALGMKELSRLRYDRLSRHEFRGR